MNDRATGMNALPGDEIIFPWRVSPSFKRADTFVDRGNVGATRRGVGEEKGYRAPCW